MGTSIEQFVLALTELIDGREAIPTTHSRRVGELAYQMALLFGLPAYQTVIIRHAGMLHDLGKIKVPDSIRFKPGPLTGEERNVIRQHPIWSSQIMSMVDDLQPAIEIAIFHHERWDGSGYPYGLTGEEIPLGARFVAIAEVYDSLVTPTCYRQSWPAAQVSSYLNLHAGKMFNTDVVKGFLSMVKERELVYV